MIDWSIAFAGIALFLLLVYFGVVLVARNRPECAMCGKLIFDAPPYTIGDRTFCNQICAMRAWVESP